MKIRFTKIESIIVDIVDVAGSRSTKFKPVNYFCNTTQIASAKITSRKNFRLYGMAVIIMVHG